VRCSSGTHSPSFVGGNVIESVWLDREAPPRGIAGTNSGMLTRDVYWNIETTRAPQANYRGKKQTWRPRTGWPPRK
jgi:hypothetical protein